jgi:hypothetical protein
MRDSIQLGLLLAVGLFAFAAHEQSEVGGVSAYYSTGQKK